MDWVPFLTARNIPFEGSSRGNIVIRCPMCGSGDPSMHMSISTDGRGWRCWRNPLEHRGRSPVRLVSALIGCSLQEAIRISGVRTVALPENPLASGLVRLEQMVSGVRAVPEPPPPLRLPREFRPLRPGAYTARPYVNYLRRRGFSEATICRLSGHFDLHYCVFGPYAMRVIFPVTYKDRLVGWTGRAIGPADLRYRAYEDASCPITNYLLWYDQIAAADAETLVMVEGPFDAMKVWALGERMGVVATCFFTAAPSAAQVLLLRELLPRFRRRVLMLDSGTLGTGMRVRSLIPDLDVRVGILHDRKDPGEIADSGELHRILRRAIH